MSSSCLKNHFNFSFWLGSLPSFPSKPLLSLGWPFLEEEEASQHAKKNGRRRRRRRGFSSSSSTLFLSSFWSDLPKVAYSPPSTPVMPLLAPKGARRLKNNDAWIFDCILMREKALGTTIPGKSLSVISNVFSQILLLFLRRKTEFLNRIFFPPQETADTEAKKRHEKDEYDDGGDYFFSLFFPLTLLSLFNNLNFSSLDLGLDFCPLPFDTVLLCAFVCRGVSI